MKTVFLKKVGWIICGITCLLLSLSGASCNISSTGIEVVPLSETPPKLLTHSFIDESSLMMSFSGEVLIQNFQVIEKTSRVGWLYCMRGFETGYIPQNFTTIYIA